MSPPGPKKKYGSLLAVRLEPEMRKRLEDVAIREERTASALARILIRQGLAARMGKAAKKKKPA
jgi:predicted DNA-binding protein